MALDRRRFVKLVGGSGAFALLGCASRGDPDGGDGDGDGDNAGSSESGLDASAASDAACPTASYVDTYAVALYFGGEIGPLTGVIAADYLIADAPVDLEFWHGHGGLSHRFVLLPEHYDALLRGDKVMIETTEVEAHSHMLFIDPSDPQYTVPGATAVEIPVCG